MVNLDYDKTYNNFAEHPLAPLYFKYLDIIVSKNLNYDVRHLRDIAHSPLTPENMKIISEVAFFFTGYSGSIVHRNYL